MSNIEYDENGGIVSLEKDVENKRINERKGKRSYNFLERLMIRQSRKINYLLDKKGKYKCRTEKTPKVVRIGPTNLCTAQCKYCPREHIHRTGHGYMDFAVFERILDWSKQNGIETISFALFGEPLLHQRIFAMLEKAKESGMEVGISTNAIILDQEKARKLIDLNLSSIEMSLDGYNDLEYREGKQVAKYKEAKQNIEYLLEYAKERKSQAKFNIHFVDAGNVSSKNKKKFVQYWSKQLEGLNHVTSYYYEPHNWAGTRNDLRENLPLLDKLLGKFELKKPCVYIKGLNIDWNGNALICTNDPTEKAVIGNVTKEDPGKIYNGERRMKYLEAHEKGDFRDLNCAACTVNAYWPLLFLKKRVVNFLSKK